MTQQVDYRQALSAILACVRQEKVTVPVDLTVDNDATIPVRVTTQKQQTQNLDFNDQGKSPTYTMLTARGFKIDAVFVRFQLPAQLAKKPIDQVCYDSLPGINIISSFQTGLSSGFAFESINSLAIRERLIDYYGIKHFKHFAKQWFGGYKDAEYTGPYQKMMKAPPNSNSKDSNVIIPPVRITLPLPSCLFYNKEKFCFSLSMETALEFKFTFYPISRVLNYSRDYTPTPLTGTLEVYMRILNPNEYSSFWTGLSYTNPYNNNPYYFVDRYFEYQVKTYIVSQEMRLQVRPAPTTKIHGFICPRHWSINDVFLGHTVDEAAKNYIASMITHTTKNTNNYFTINLGTGTFPDGKTSLGQNLSIVGWSETATSFQLVWGRNASVTNIVQISCSKPFGQISNLYLDLAAFAPSSSPNIVGQLDMFLATSIFLLDSFHLDIQDYDPNVHIELPDYSYDVAKKLYNGLFTYNPNQNNVNQLALVSVDKVIPSRNLSSTVVEAPREFAHAYLFSMRVPTQNAANMLITQNYKHINKTNHVYYDLDGLYPIRVDSVAFEKTVSNTETIPNDELDLHQDLFKDRHFWSPSLQLVYEFGDFKDENKKSLGFNDLRTADVMNILIKLQTEEIRYSEILLIDTLKDYNTKAWEIEVSMLQYATRMLKYYKGTLEVMTDAERLESNNFIMSEILIKNELYQPPQLEALQSSAPTPMLRSDAGKRSLSPGSYNIRNSSRMANPYSQQRASINTQAAGSHLQATSKRPKYF